jgi:hypothetical protein
MLAEEALAMAGPENVPGTPRPGRGRLRASHADRERVVDVLKAAFVEGRLTEDELDARVGQALAARTYADLAALTADLPAEPGRIPAPTPAPLTTTAGPALAQPHNRSARTAVKVGAYTVTGIILAISGAAIALGQPVAAVVLAMFGVALVGGSTAFIAALLALVLKAEARHRNRSGGQLPPGPASGQAAPPAADRNVTDRNVTDPPRPHRRRPPGTLAVTPAR